MSATNSYFRNFTKLALLVLVLGVVASSNSARASDNGQISVGHNIRDYTLEQANFDGSYQGSGHKIGSRDSSMNGDNSGGSAGSSSGSDYQSNPTETKQYSQNIAHFSKKDPNGQLHKSFPGGENSPGSASGSKSAPESLSGNLEKKAKASAASGPERVQTVHIAQPRTNSLEIKQRGNSRNSSDGILPGPYYTGDFSHDSRWEPHHRNDYFYRRMITANKAKAISTKGPRSGKPNNPDEDWTADEDEHGNPGGAFDEGKERKRDNTRNRPQADNKTPSNSSQSSSNNSPSISPATAARDQMTFPHDEPHPAPPGQGSFLKTDGVKAFVNNVGATGQAAGKMVGGSMAAASAGAAAVMANKMKNTPGANMAQSKANQNAQKEQGADNLAAMERYHAAAAIDWVRSFLENFTTDGGNKWNQTRDRLFVPVAILLMLPGAVICQVKSIASQGLVVLGEINPFEGIFRSIVGIFLVPATYLVVNYGIDIANSLTETIGKGYQSIFGSDMYTDAFCGHIRAFPIREPEENAGMIMDRKTQMFNYFGNTPLARLEGKTLSIKYEDPCSGLYIVPPDRDNDNVPYMVNEQRLAYNQANAAFTMCWVILCAVQQAYLYYLWFVGPVVAALWIYPSKQLREAFPSWIEGVVTLCCWSLFWSITILLMACFRGVDDTGTIMFTALNFLAIGSAKFAFDFTGLVKDAGREAMSMAQKAAQAAAKASSKGGGGGGGGGGKGGGGGGGGGAESAGAGNVASNKGAAGANGADGIADTGNDPIGDGPGYTPQTDKQFAMNPSPKSESFNAAHVKTNAPPTYSQSNPNQNKNHNDPSSYKPFADMVARGTGLVAGLVTGIPNALMDLTPVDYSSGAGTTVADQNGKQPDAGTFTSKSPATDPPPQTAAAQANPLAGSISLALGAALSPALQALAAGLPSQVNPNSQTAQGNSALASSNNPQIGINQDSNNNANKVDPNAASKAYSEAYVANINSSQPPVSTGTPNADTQSLPPSQTYSRQAASDDGTQPIIPYTSTSVEPVQMARTSVDIDTASSLAANASAIADAAAAGSAAAMSANSSSINFDPTIQSNARASLDTNGMSVDRLVEEIDDLNSAGSPRIDLNSNAASATYANEQLAHLHEQQASHTVHESLGTSPQQVSSQAIEQSYDAAYEQTQKRMEAARENEQRLANQRQEELKEQSRQARARDSRFGSSQMPISSGAALNTNKPANNSKSGSGLSQAQTRAEQRKALLAKLFKNGNAESNVDPNTTETEKSASAPLADNLALQVLRRRSRTVKEQSESEKAADLEALKNMTNNNDEQS